MCAATPSTPSTLWGCKERAKRRSTPCILREDDDTPDWSAPECAARALRAFGGYGEALRERLLAGEISSGLARECIRGLQEAGLTGWEDKIPEEFGYLLEADE